MKQRILDKVEESFKKAESYYNRTFSRPKHIVFKRNGTTGGWCWYSRSELMFQLDLAEHNGDDFLNQTVPHEVAHWIDKEVFGFQRCGSRRSIHGDTWKSIMRRVYGLNPDRCHDYDVSVTITKKQDRYEYVCGCFTTHKISTTLHNKILRGEWRKCKRCNQRISWKNGNVIPKINPLSLKDQEIARLKEQIAQLQSKQNQ